MTSSKETPSKETLESEAKHFANTVFAIGAGVLILAASFLQPHVMRWTGSETGGHLLFLAATIAIFLLSGKRPDFALLALKRQCKKYGHVLSEGATACSRCFEKIA